ncbi:MAG: tetratricopeptide repeat protein [bacterium]
MRSIKLIILLPAIILALVFQSSCNFVTHKTLSTEQYDSTAGNYEPNYNSSLDFSYQDFTSYLFIGNRVENFTAYFNTFFKSQQDFEEAMDEYNISLISFYNRRLDSLGINPPVGGSVKEKLDKAIERSSKIIQFHQNSKFIDNAVLIVGESYYYLGSYYKAERTFNEFLSKFSSSPIADEAILFLGRTKFKLGKLEESEKIFQNLFKNSTDNETKSFAASELGILSYNKGRYQDAVNYFNSAIDFSKNTERKAQSQFILAKILSGYKPELSASEYRNVLTYTSDFDLSFFARLNYAKGLLYNKEFDAASEELDNLRRKYRDEISFTQLVDLEIANNLFGQNKIKEAQEKYYEVIVKYPNTPVSSDAYYHLAKYEEEVNNDYMNALVNYKKAVGESIGSDFYKESSSKSSTFEKYFNLLGEVGDSSNITIPNDNAAVEEYRKIYNEEKGIEIENKTVNPPEDDGRQRGDGKGKSGGKMFAINSGVEDSIKEEPIDIKAPSNNPSNSPSTNPGNQEKGREINIEENDTGSVINNDSLKAISDSLKAEEEIRLGLDKEERVFNAYYSLAELFLYDLNKKDSTEYYLKFLTEKYPESAKQQKLLYTLANFYKNYKDSAKANETFNKLIDTYPNSIYAFESKKILGIKINESEIYRNPLEQIFNQVMYLMNNDKYAEAIIELQGVESTFPNDTLVAKSLYSIGWIYENKFFNKDSSVLYYKKLKEKFPSSEYAQKVSPMLDYIASLEVPVDSTKIDSTKENSTSDSLKSENPEINTEEIKKSEIEGEKKIEEVKTDTTSVDGENKLTQDEIDKLLKESEQPTEPPPDK